MKRVFAMLMVLLLLTGCTAEPEQTSAPTTTAAPTEPSVSLYDPASDVEEMTEGAVRAYPMTGHNIQGFRFVGQDILLFTKDEHVELTTLMLLQGDLLNITKRLTLDGALYPTDAHLRIGQQAVGYYNQAENSVVILDHQLKEVRRVQLPDDVRDTPVLNDTMELLYYCVNDEIRVLDLNTGISQLLKQHTCQSQSLVGMHFNDAVLEVYVTQEDGSGHVAFVSVENGQTIGDDAGLMSIYSEGAHFLLQRMDATVRETLVGKLEGQLQSLDLGTPSVVCQALSINAVLAGSGDTLSLYDLASGKITSRVSLGNDVQITGAAVAPGGNYVWIQGYDSTAQCDVLYRWDIGATEVNEPAVYLKKRYTQADPDVEGLAQCQQQADALSEKYGVKILVGDTLPQPEGYVFTYEHQVSALQNALEQLDVLLAKYPENIIPGMCQVSKNDVIYLGLVRSICDSADLPVPDENGLHYVLNGDHYIALAVDVDMENAFHHQMCHVLDSKVYSVSKALDLWEELNPEGFEYFSTYQNVEVAPEDPNLQGDTRAFVDAYSMTFVKEDRARIFERAITEGNEALFQPEIMQAKLFQLCLGIREAYGLQKETELILPWEQYLVQPVNWGKSK